MGYLYVHQVLEGMGLHWSFLITMLFWLKCPGGIGRCTGCRAHRIRRVPDPVEPPVCTAERGSCGNTSRWTFRLAWPRSSENRTIRDAHDCPCPDQKCRRVSRTQRLLVHRQRCQFDVIDSRPKRCRRSRKDCQIYPHSAVPCCCLTVAWLLFLPLLFFAI